MQIVSREVAERKAEKLRRQQKPRMYCIARYINRLTGQEQHAFCYNTLQYMALCEREIDKVALIWTSPQFELDSIASKAVLNEARYNRK